MVCCFFFFQAEDGIRDLVRSRGLGDVYKRQVVKFKRASETASLRLLELNNGSTLQGKSADNPDSVSYTHLTLPTSDLV